MLNVILYTLLLGRCSIADYGTMINRRTWRLLVRSDCVTAADSPIQQ